MPEPGSSLRPDVEVRASPIAGRGLFATVDLPAGTGVVRLSGALVVDADQRVVAPGSSPFANHSCDPNLGWADEHSLATMTDVAAGQELVTDYAMSVVEADWFLRCHCPSYRCRQMVEGSDWRIPALQQRYDGWWAPHVQRLVDAARGARPAPSPGVDEGEG
jgi:hypothetical protein